MKRLKKKKTLISLIFILVVTTIVIAIFKLLPDSKAEEASAVTKVEIVYQNKENNQTVTITKDVVDREIGNGRVWIDSIATVQNNNAEFTGEITKEFLGWEYSSSVILGSNSTKTSAYEQGEHFTQDEYYSVSSNETKVTLNAVWGNKVYVDGINGIDDADGLTSSTPVRTIGRAYEVLARLDSNNENANITGFKVSGDSSLGFTYLEEDLANKVTRYNGKIVLLNDVSYKDANEGRYKYVTYGDLVNSPNYSAGTVVYNDGVSNKKITNLQNLTKYTEDDPVKLRYKSKDTYEAQQKAASGSHHFLLKKELNSYSYEVNGTTYYTYGRLVQYTENLRAHVGKGLMTPENDGLVVITAEDTGSSMDFADYTRYASGGDIIFKNIALSFYHDKTLDVELETYVGGYAANGHYIAFDENVTIRTGTILYKPNVYGGGHAYRWSSYNYTGEGGNNLGNAGQKTLTKTRITVKSGTYLNAFGGSYGQTVGEAVESKGTTENNAAVINVYGGNFSTGIGMGHEGATAINSYVYVYGGTSDQIHGSGIGSTGSMSGNGKTNVLIAKEANAKIVYGGSGNGSHKGDINIVVNGGKITSMLYGGNGSTNVDGNINIKITGGTITSIVGGCATGNVNGNVSIDMSGGTVNGTIYTSGQGNTATQNTTYYGGDENATGYGAQIVDTNDERLNLLITGNAETDAKVIEYSIKQFNSNLTQYHNDNQYTVNGMQYYYPNVYKDDYSSVITGLYRSTYYNHGCTQYTVNRQASELSLATVANTELNITGGTVNGNIFGGGKVSVVKGNVNINIGNATINGNVYGGGDGTYEPKVNLTTTTGSGHNQNKKETFTWKGTETFDLTQYDINKNVPIDYENKYIYSPNYDYMGGVEGNVEIKISNASTITGSVFGGGNAGNVFGTTQISVNDSKVTNNIYGGGYSGTVEKDVTINAENAQGADLYGGGYSGNIKGNTTINLVSGTFNNVFGGCDQAYVNGNTVLTVGNSSNPVININKLLYGGGRGVIEEGQQDASNYTTVYGTSTVTIEGRNTNVGSYGSTKLGAVNGQVDVTFINYKTGNATNQYKVMAGIDRADNVRFENSYVLLTNVDSEGNQIGIKAIKNLYVPSGSGLKISAESEISGNFEGGGELYFDSKVCLNVNGYVSGNTTLILNPILYNEEGYDGEYVIVGGEENAYMVVRGSTEEQNAGMGPDGTSITLKSGDTRYTMFYKNDGTCTKYYIDGDVVVGKSVAETIKLKEGKEFTGTTQSWALNNINVIQNNIITTADINLHYEYKNNNEFKGSFENLKRSIVIKSGQNEVTIPEGTKIIMVVNENEYYQYVVGIGGIDKANLSDFVTMGDTNTNYNEIHDITKKATGDVITAVYTYSEQFRFILDFSECEEKDYLEYDKQNNTFKTYNILLNVVDEDQKIEGLSFIAENTIHVYPKRYFEYTNQISKQTIAKLENIQITGNINAVPITSDIYYTYAGKNYAIKLSLKDKQGKYIKIPSGTVIKVNGVECEGIYIGTEITREAINQEFNIDFDMSKVILNTEQLSAGDYSIEVGAYVLENNVLVKKINSQDINFKILDGTGYGIDLSWINEAENEDKLQLFNKDKSIKTLRVNLSESAVQNKTKVKIKVQKRDSAFTYIDTKETVKEIPSDSIAQTNDIQIDTSKLKAGMYRIVAQLSDSYDNEYIQAVINFIVK